MGVVFFWWGVFLVVFGFVIDVVVFVGAFGGVLCSLSGVVLCFRLRLFVFFFGGGGFCLFLYVVCSSVFVLFFCFGDL